MKTYILTFFLLVSFSMSSQSIFGKWKTIDDEPGKEKSVVEIYEKEGKVFGKIIDILNGDKNALCDKCEGEDKNTKILGFELIKNLTKSGIYYRNGTIFDPEQGKKYKCRLALKEGNPEVLEVRGYIAFMYESQYWERLN